MEKEKPGAITAPRFPSAKEDAEAVVPPSRYQGPESSYRLAFRDTDFLLREELRPVRFQLELLKTEMLLEEAKIGSTLVVYGSARIPSPEHCEAVRATATTPERMKVVERLIAKSKYYE